MACGPAPVMPLEEWDPMAETYNNTHLNSYSNDLGQAEPHGRNPTKMEHRLHISNLPIELDEDGLRDIFKRCGNPLGIFCATDRKWAFVSFATFREAELAVRTLNDQPPLHLKVSFSNNENKPSRQTASARMHNLERPSQQAQEFIPVDRMFYPPGTVRNSRRGRDLLSIVNSGPPTRQPQIFENNNDPLYSPVDDPNYFNPYEDPGDFEDTNTMYTRSQIKIGNDGRRYVTMGRGYTWYALPPMRPDVPKQIQSVYEQRRAGLYEFGENKLKNEIGNCVMCGKQTHMRCARCRGFYCSRICQTTDWPRHKEECFTMPDLEGVEDLSSLSHSSSEEAPVIAQPRKLRRPVKGMQPPPPRKFTSTPSIPSVPSVPTPAAINRPIVPDLDKIPASTAKSGDQKTPTIEPNVSKPSAIPSPLPDSSKNPPSANTTVADRIEHPPSVSRRLDRSLLPNKPQSPTEPVQQNEIRPQFSRGSNYDNRNYNHGHARPPFNVNNNNIHPAAQNTQQTSLQSNQQRPENQPPRYPQNVKSPESTTINDFPKPEAAHAASLNRVPNAGNRPQQAQSKPMSAMQEVYVSSQSPKLAANDKKTANDSVAVAVDPLGPSLPRPSNVNREGPSTKEKSVVNMLVVDELGSFEVHTDLGGKKYATTIGVTKVFDAYEMIMSKLTRDCEQMPKNPNFTPKVSDLICGKQHDYWVRGHVMSLGPPVHISVMDEGRMGTVTDVLPIPPEYVNLPVLGATCEVIGDLKLEAMQCYKFTVLKVGVKNVEIMIMNKKNAVPALLTVWSPAPEQKRIKLATLVSGAEVHLASYTNQNSLFVRSLLPADLEVFHRTIQDVAKFATSAPALGTPPVEGDLVFCKFSKDGNFYRGIVKSPDGNKCRVVYVDFGNSEETTIENMRQMPYKIKEYPSMVAKIILKGVPNDVPMTAEANAFLASLVGTEKPMICTFDGSPTKDGVVLKTADGSSVNAKLSELLQPSWKKGEEDKTVYMMDALEVAELGPVGETTEVIALQHLKAGVFVMAPQDRELCGHVQGVMSKEIQNYVARNTDHYIPRFNELCLAPFEGVYYRAVCLNPNVTSSSSELMFLDYGNIEVVANQDIRVMTKDFMSCKALANICYVSGLSKDQEPGLVTKTIETRLKECVPLLQLITVKIVNKKDVGEYVIELPSVRNILVKEGLVPPP